jgi:hypothetical protein
MHVVQIGFLNDMLFLREPATSLLFQVHMEMRVQRIVVQDRKRDLHGFFFAKLLVETFLLGLRNGVLSTRE